MTEARPELEERFVVLSAFVGGLVFELDAQGNYLDGGAGEPKLLARPVSDLPGRNVLDVLGREVGGRLREVVERALGTGTPETLAVLAREAPLGSAATEALAHVTSRRSSACS